MEFKGPGSRTGNRQLTAKVVRACLSMANNRDGGIVVIGVEEGDAGELLPVGLTEDELATWQHDHLADTLAEYADPSISFDSQVTDHQGNSYMVIEVHEFPDIPVLCKKEYQGVLRRGACYVRTRRKPETAEISTQQDMRDLLDLATEKGVRKFLTQAYEAGLSVSGRRPRTDEELFESEISDLVEGSR